MKIQNKEKMTKMLTVKSLKYIYYYHIDVLVYLWGFYDIKFILTQCKSKPGLIPQYT